MARTSKEEAFQKLLDELNKAGGAGGVFYHPTPGDTKIRLVLLGDDTDITFYREVINKWGKTRYLVAAVLLEAPDQPEDQAPQLRGVVLPITALRGIVGNLKAGWDLFDPEKGHGVLITREGTGKFDTSYQVNLSTQSVDITALEFEAPEGGLDEWAEIYNSRGNDDDTPAEPEEPKKGSKGKKSAGIPW